MKEYTDTDTDTNTTNNLFIHPNSNSNIINSQTAYTFIDDICYNTQSIIEQEFVKNLTQEERTELSNLEEFIDAKLYFYGSVMRLDYLKNMSDIDFCIFTKNTEEVKKKIQLFFQLPSEKCFNKIIWKLNNRFIYGSKVKCKKFIDRKYEISIYEEKFKQIVLNEHNKTSILSPITSLFYIILKLLFFYNIIGDDMFHYIKNTLYNNIKKQKPNDNIFFVI